MTVSICKHSHPVQPPLGSIFHPGACTSCGTTWTQVQDELRKQEQALILGTSHDGTCPNCSQPRRLFRYQPQDKPWTPIGHEEPVSFLCPSCWNTAAETDRAQTNEDGRTSTTIVMKRYCPDGHLVGDVTDAEVEAAICGVRLPDVRSECPTCTPTA